MSPQASRILDAMGVLEQIERCWRGTPRGNAHSRAERYRRFRAVRGCRGLSQVPGPWPRAARTILDGLLLDRARAVGAIVREGERVTSLRRDPNGRVTGVDAIDGSGRTRRSRAFDRRRRRRLALDRRSAARPRGDQTRAAPTGVRHAFRRDRRHGRQRRDARRARRLPRARRRRRRADERCRRRPARARARTSSGDAAAFVDAWIGHRPTHGAALCARATARHRCSRPARLHQPRAARGRRVPRSLATPPTSSTRSPAKGSTRRCAAQNSSAPRIVDALAATLTADATTRPARVRPGRACRDSAANGLSSASSEWRLPSLPLMNVAARSLALRPRMAHTIVGVTGDFVPAREVLRPGFLLRLLLAMGTPLAP